MANIHVTVWEQTSGEGAPAVFVHNIFTWGSDEAYGFAAQRPLPPSSGGPQGLRR